MWDPGISAAYVSNSAAVNNDANYVRRVTFNVGRVVEQTTTSVILAQPLLAGVPATGSSAQVVSAFVDREGGSFFQEWSAMFVVEPESGRTGSASTIHGSARILEQGRTV